MASTKKAQPIFNIELSSCESSGQDRDQTAFEQLKESLNKEVEKQTPIRGSALKELPEFTVAEKSRIAFATHQIQQFSKNLLRKVYKGEKPDITTESL